MIDNLMARERKYIITEKQLKQYCLLLAQENTKDMAPMSRVYALAEKYEQKFRSNQSIDCVEALTNIGASIVQTAKSQARDEFAEELSGQIERTYSKSGVMNVCDLLEYIKLLKEAQR